MHCKNCNQELKTTQRFCDECSSPIIRNRLTPKVLIQQVNREFLSIDNKFLQTLISLVIKPEGVIDGYINGVRKKYIGVITYYAISLTILGFQMFLLKHFFSEFLDSQNGFFNDSFKMGSAGANNPMSNFPDIFNDYQGVFFSILMPFIAIGTWIVFLDNRKYNYTEHLVINLYATSQTIYFSFFAYICLALLNISNYLIVSLIITPITVIYGTFVFKRLYKLSFINVLIRYIAAYIIYTIVFGIIIFLIVVIMLLYLYTAGKLNI